jgi:hypothetical protein
MRFERMLLWWAAALIALITPSSAIGAPPSSDPEVSVLVAGLEGAVGSTVGPGGPCM